MWSKYLKLALRILVKQGSRSLINILGFGFGIAVCILIYMYARMELSYNDFHENRGKIYRVCNSYVEANGERRYSPFMPYELSLGMAEEIPAVEKSCGLRSNTAWIGEKDRLFEEVVGFTDSSFMDMFSFRVIAGNRENPLSHPQSVVLTKGVADKLFGDSIREYDVMIGKSILFPQPVPNLFTVTAILEDPPENNSFRWSLLIPYSNARYYPQCNNAFGNTSIYIMLHPDANMAAAEEASQALIEEFHGERIQQLVHFGYLADGDDNFSYFFQPLEDLYLHSNELSGCYEITGNIRIIYILSSIAALILLIACFNYVMLTIASTMNRMKDIGLMNVVGAQKGQIIRSFITECSILTLIALGLGLLLSKLLLPVFNQLVSSDLEFMLFRDWINFAFLLLLCIAIVLSTTLYVSQFLLRKNQPLQILRQGQLRIKRQWFARFFIMAQYLITVILLICAGIIVKQLNYMLGRDVGFDRENIVVLSVDFPYQKVLTLKDRLLQYPSVKSVSMSDRNFISGSSSNDIKNEAGDLVLCRFLRIDADYLETFGIELIAGRNFTRDEAIEDNFNIIVNEKLVREFGLESPLGEVIPVEPGEIEATIIGVVKDFHFDSMHDEIMPVMLIVFPFNSIWAVFVKIDGRNVNGALEQIEKAWNEVVPEFTIEYSFLSDMLDSQYNTEERWSRTTAYASAIAIILSCLGLIGITSLLVARRTKEVGIRKANGASSLEIVLLLNRDILKWILFSFILACPAAWFIIRRWLRDFDYRTGVSWWIFALAGLSVLFISLIAISWLTWRAARQNPVRTLRYE